MDKRGEIGGRAVQRHRQGAGPYLADLRHAVSRAGLSAESIVLTRDDSWDSAAYALCADARSDAAGDDVRSIEWTAHAIPGCGWISIAGCGTASEPSEAGAQSFATAKIADAEWYLRLRIADGLQNNRSRAEHDGIVQHAHRDPSRPPIKSESEV